MRDTSNKNCGIITQKHVHQILMHGAMQLGASLRRNWINILMFYYYANVIICLYKPSVQNIRIFGQSTVC